MKLPTVIASSVVRSSQQGESHGGVYLVDLEQGTVQQVIDWNDPGIDWQGRGSDRGLRGIAFYEGNVYLAASDEIFVFDRAFELLRSFRNPYLKHCHEICRDGTFLYLTSTGFNSVLKFDLQREVFVGGWQLRETSGLRRWFTKRYLVTAFDPGSTRGLALPKPDSSLHLNSVSRFRGATYVSGTRIDGLLHLDGARVHVSAQLPRGTHNAAKTSEGVIYNDTARGAAILRQGSETREFVVPTYDPAELTHTEIPRDHARQGFARGLIYESNLIIVGSSPSTISAFDVLRGERLRSVNLSKDIRNCIHGLEIWPDALQA